MVGVLNTATDLLVFALCFGVVGAPLLISNVVGVGTAVLVSFFANRSWTFAAAHDAKLDGRRQFVRHAALAVFTLLVSSLVIHLAASVMPAYAAKLCASICTVALGYTISRRWVFAK